jgi:cyanophycinase
MNRFSTVRALLLATVFGMAPTVNAQDHGPARGTLVISGGGETTSHIMDRFIELAGGPDAPILVVPTSGNEDEYDDSCTCLERFRRAGATNVRVLHTRDRDVANSESFVEPLRQARAVWFQGGSHWRHADAYLDTKTHEELFALLDRGGVIGGGSAGAHIQSDYMNVSRSPETEFSERTLPREQWRRGLRLVRNVIIDVHILARNRQFDMIGVIDAHPDMLGIAMDENTAIVVQGDTFEVIGTSYVLIYDRQRQIAPEGPETLRTVGGPFYFLRAGDTYDMKTRQALRPSGQQPMNRLVEKVWGPR